MLARIPDLAPGLQIGSRAVERTLEPVRVDRWLLSELRPLATGAGRGLAAGTLRTAAGALVATVVQEALLRLPDRRDGGPRD